MKKHQLILLLVLASIKVFADEPLINPTIKPYVNLQFWNMYSEGFDTGEESAPARVSSYFRRGRVGVKGQLMENLTYNVQCSFDYLGKDPSLASKGKMNTGDFSLWYANATWNALPNSSWLMVTGGTFLPHLSRETATSSMTTSSLDKLETSNYLRQFVTGRTNGVCPGINIGGLGEIGKSQLLYNVAYVTRQDNTSITKTKWSPVLMGHVILNVGDKEWSSYKYTFSGNTLKKQKLVSLGLGASTQGETDVFSSSSTYGSDIMVYLGGFKIDGGYYFLHRKNQEDYLAQCFWGRASWNFFLKNDWIIEPVVAFDQFKGDDVFQDASFFDGKDKALDSGINLISAKRKVKVSLHYIHRSGGGTSNHYVTSSGKYGDYLNLGIQLTI